MSISAVLDIVIGTGDKIGKEYRHGPTSKDLVDFSNF